MVTVCLPSDALSQCLLSYWSFSYLVCGISSQLLQQRASAAPYLGCEVSPHSLCSRPWTWAILCQLTHINQITKIKHKQQILKAEREKQQIRQKGIPIRITADLSVETLQARREGQDTLKVMKEKNLQPRLLYPARTSLKYEGEIKSFTDKQKLREFSTTKPALQQMLKDLL